MLGEIRPSRQVYQRVIEPSHPDFDAEIHFSSTSRFDPSSRRRQISELQDTGSFEGSTMSSMDVLPETSPLVPYWSVKRHLTCGNPTPSPVWSQEFLPWRGSTPGKIKTANSALVLCLNIDVDPPDIVKTNPCAVMESWVDPHSMPSRKALEAIASNLQLQFESLSLKIAYKSIVDPSLEDLRRFCQTLRKQAKSDAVLFYYNGHGVPKPTPSGELWCFNRQYTQYIPVSIQEVQNWIGSPGVYIWECSAAGNLLNNFNAFARRRDQEARAAHGEVPHPFMESLQLAACGANEQLPSCPDLPADLFTACLTSPIDMALRWFMMNNKLPDGITMDMVIQMPGDLKDRRTPLGELNWIFTAITDTIAWTTFPRDLFVKLYRSDLLIASLFRNFLLAERIMKNYHCNPITEPRLPPTNTHALWDTWDLAVDTCIRQLPELLYRPPELKGGNLAKLGISLDKLSPRNDPFKGLFKYPDEKPYVYVPNSFFADQLTAFEVWISRGGSALTKQGPMSLPVKAEFQASSDQSKPSTNGDAKSSEVSDETRQLRPKLDGLNDQRHLVPRKPPDQLPIVLQVLLSQPHRLRALILLSQFVDLGPWAVHLVLTIGIFPYISKLLQAAGQDLRPVLIFIWARILAVDQSVQHDLFQSGGFKYFANVLALRNDDVLPNGSEHKAMCSFILSAVSREFPYGQVACWMDRVFDNCYDRLEEPDFLLRQWTALCIAQMWAANDDIKIYGVDRGTQDRLIRLLSDDSAEVRSAALYALGTFMGASASLDPARQGGGGTGTMYHLEERVHFRMEVAVATGATLAIKDDASPMCRKELLVLISCLVKEWRGHFVICAWLYWEEDRRWRAGATSHTTSYIHDDDITNQAVAEWLDSFGDDDMLREENRVLLSSFFTIYVVLLDLSVDPYVEVAIAAQTIVDYITALLLESPFTRLDSSTLDFPPTTANEKRVSSVNAPGDRSRVPSTASATAVVAPPSPNPERPTLMRADTLSNLSSTLRRTSSFANATSSFIKSIAFPSTDDGRTFAPSPSGSVNQHETVKLTKPPPPNLVSVQYESPYPDLLESPDKKSPHESQQRAYDFQAFHVIEALVEEDMERLRARRRVNPRKAQQQQHTGSAPSPSNSTFSHDSSVILGLGTGAGICDVLPLRSTFYDWCCEYFKEPQMRQAEADEPGSIQFNYQMWRSIRNEQITAETLEQAPRAENCRWDRPVATIQTTGCPLTMVFHSYDQQLVVANESDTISVYDWSTRKRLSQWCNGNPRGTSITSVHIINQDVGGIIVVGSAEGVVRLYRNYDPVLEQGPVQMVSAFRALNEVIQLRQGAGVILDWKQSEGILIAGGDSRIIRVWDAQTETQSLDLDTNSESPLTAMASDVGPSQTFLGSFADGTVKLFDRRIEEEDSIVRTYSDHTSWIQNVRWHPKTGAQFLSASVDGEIKLWDMRGHNTPIKTWNIHPQGLSVFDVHPLSGVFAASSAISGTNWRAQKIAISSLSKPQPLSTYHIQTGLTMAPLRSLPSPFIPRLSALAFHPAEMLYGLGQPDGSIRIMGCNLASADPTTT